MTSQDEDSPEAACERLIWSQAVSGITTAPAAHPTSWAGSVQAEVRAFGFQAEISWPTEPAAPYPRVAVVMMAKDEGDIIGHNLRWLYFVGVRRFVVIDNASTDDTAAQLAAVQRALPDMELLTISDPIVRHMQAQKTTGIYRLALAVWPDLQWVFPVDADEFLIPLRGFEVLESVGPRVDALTIPKSIHFRNARERGDDRALFFERMDFCSPIFEVPPKIGLRRNPFIAIAQGNHKVELMTRPEVYEGGFQHGFYFREYPVRGFEHFIRKTRNGGRAIHAAEAFLGHSVGGTHWMQAYDALLTGGEAALMAFYERHWVTAPAERFRAMPFRGVPG